ESRVAGGLPNHGGVERRTDAADALAPPQGLRDEKAGDLNLSPSLLVYLEDVRPEGRRPYERVPLGGPEGRPTGAAAGRSLDHGVFGVSGQPAELLQGDGY